jgi:hypothetical protein
MKNDGKPSQGKPVKQAGKTIPDKPRDCGPHVDTWPILDAEAGDSPRASAKERAHQTR